MNTPQTSPADRAIALKSFIPYLAITFGLAWGILALFLFLPDLMTRLFGALSGNHPLFFLAVYAPAIGALTIVWRAEGASGFRRFVARFAPRKCPWPWATFLLVGLPLVFYGGSALKGNLVAEPFPFETQSALAVALLLSAIKGPVEEFGWRGFALPLLQRHLAPFWSALLLGMIWGFWHLPVFVLSGTQQSAWSFNAFFAGTVAISVIATALYNATRGSIFFAAVFHFQLMNPIWPDAQPYDTYLLLVIAAIVALVDRKKMFDRQGGLTEIVPADRSPEPVGLVPLAQ